MIFTRIAGHENDGLFYRDGSMQCDGMRYVLASRDDGSVVIALIHAAICTIP